MIDNYNEHNKWNYNEKRRSSSEKQRETGNACADPAWRAISALRLRAGGVSIVGVEPGQPGPVSGQLRILFAILVSTETPPKPNLTIKEVSLSDDVSFTITNEDTKQSIVVSNPTIDQDPAFSYARFNEQGKMGEHQLGILIPYTLKPGRYRVTNVTGKVWYASSGGGKSSESLRIGEEDDTSFTIAAPTPAPTAVPDTSNLPKTGDSSSPALWLAVCLGCVAAVALLLRKRSAR